MSANHVEELKKRRRKAGISIAVVFVTVILCMVSHLIISWFVGRPESGKAATEQRQTQSETVPTSKLQPPTELTACSWYVAGKGADHIAVSSDNAIKLTLERLRNA